MSTSPNVVILGGGIIGLSTAYYLLSDAASYPVKVTLIEPHRIAHGASSRAMGMIAETWHDRDVLPLAKLSWRCYRDLVSAHNGGQEFDWTMSKVSGVDVGSSKVKPGRRSAYRKLPAGRHVAEREWLSGERYDMTGSGGVALLHPAKFCAFLHRRCTELGMITHLATPVSIERTGESRTLLVDDPSIPGIPLDKLLLAAGPWTAHVAKKLGLPVPAITNIPGHSIILRPADSESDSPSSSHPPEAGETFFAGISGEVGPSETADAGSGTGGGEKLGGYTPSIEFCTRPDATVYIAGENSIPHSSLDRSTTLSNHLPADPSQVIDLVDQSLVDRLLRSAVLTSPLLNIKRGAELVKAQLCYRPSSPDGNPLIGRLGMQKEEEGVYVAAGHGPWGITLGPGTGRTMAELLLGRKPSVDLSPFDPARF